LALAEASYRRALTLTPSLPAAQNNLAMLLLHREGDLGEALDLATRAAAAGDHPLCGNFLDTLAQVQAAAGDYGSATATMTRALAVHPHNADWAVRLADFLLSSGQADQARHALTRAENLCAAGSRLSDESRQRLDALRAVFAQASDRRL
jgi:Flp pilus assembly protein TadD